MNKQKPRPPITTIASLALMIMGGLSFLINLISLPLIFKKLSRKTKGKTKK